jgi:cobalt/nickel transport system permease protein
MERMALADWIQIGRMDDLARMDSPAHRLDARAKAVVTLAFVIVVMSFPRHEVSALAPFLLYPVILTSVGRIPARELFRKILVAAPFALVIGVFNPLLDRHPVVAVGPVAITGGWLSFASIMLRFVLTVWAALALVACTGMFRLAAGLERLGIPRVFVVQLLFLYRYLFVVADEGSRMTRSVELRAAGKNAMRLRVYGSLIGHLLLRSMDRADRVYRAMVSRGFDGEIRVMRQSSFRASDWCFVGACLACFIVGRVWNLAAAMGMVFTGGAG